MKRVFLSVLLGGLLLNVSVIGQERGFEQTGRATQELKTGKMAAAHPSYRFGSKVWVTNIATGKRIEVTVISRINPTSNRIIDLSPDAWQELGLSRNTEVGVSPVVQTVESPPPPEPQPEPPPAVVQAEPQPAPPPAAVVQPEPPPVSPVVVLSVPLADPPAPPPPPPPAPAPAPAPQPIVMPPLEITIVLSPAPPPPPPVVLLPPAPPPPPPPPPPPLPPPPPPPPPQLMPPVVLPQPAPPPPVPQFSGVMEVVPGVPDPNTNKIYHLQVGSFSMPEAAARTIQILKNAGLNAAYEVHGQWYRVLVMGIPAPETYSTIQKLGLLGIRQVWVRE